MRGRDREREVPVVIVEKGEGGIGSFVWGALLGAGFALLFAPQSGEETRRILKNRGRRLWAAAEEKAAELQDMVASGYEDAKSRVEDAIDSRRQSARDVVDAGKAAVHSARDELERRLADARAARNRPRRTESEEPEL
jgi:gas vesicle protein